MIYGKKLHDAKKGIDYMTQRKQLYVAQFICRKELHDAKKGSDYMTQRKQLYDM